jgi:DNA primase
MRYGEGLLEEIRRRTDLVALVGRRVKLIRKGRVLWGCCPFHPEKSPSFKVENERRLYKCFGCGAGGDAFKWLMETEGMSFPEAVEKLAGEAGVELPRWSPDDEAREKRKKSLYEIVELAAVFYQEQLFGEGGRAARDYLKGRGLDGAAAKQFRLGYAPQGNALIAHLTAHNITQDEMIEAGLARPAQDGRPMRDFFFDRILFPITDGRGRVIAFGGRGLAADAKPKYINTGETPLFSKGGNLYNFPAARAAAIRCGTIVLAEGYMDVIALVRAGFAHTVAPLGTAFTEDQLQMLWRAAPEPVLAFDGDKAGQAAALRAAHMALPHLKAGHSLRFAFLPSGEDPDTLIAHQGAAAMAGLLDTAMALSDLLWRAETEGKDFSTPERLAGLERRLAEIAASVGDSQIAGYYRDAFREKVFAAYKRRTPQKGGAPGREFRRGPGRSGFPQRGPFRPLPGTPEAVSPALRQNRLVRAGEAAVRQVKEAELAGLLLEEPRIALDHAELLAELPVSDPSLDRLRAELLNLAASGSSLEKAGVQTHFARLGLADFVARLAPGTRGPDGDRQEAGTPEDDPQARFLRAAQSLREMAGGTSDHHRLLGARKTGHDGDLRR